MNLATGTSRVAQYLLAFALVIGALAASEVATVSQIIAESVAYRAAGAATMTLEATAGISGSACNALESVTGVEAAVALRRATADVTATRLPDSTIPTYELSTDLGSFVALPITGKSNDVVISRDLATALKLEIGSPLLLTTGELTVGGIMDYPDDGRRPGFGYALFIPGDLTQAFDECWIDTWPQDNFVSGLLYSTLTPNPNSPDAPPRLSQLNSSLGVHFAGETDFAQRISQFAPLAALVIGFVLGALSVRSRRLELASAQHAGVRRGVQLAQVLAETAAWALGGGILVACGLMVATFLGAETVSAAAPLATRVLLVALPGALIGAAIAAITTRERHLLRYFKDR